MYISSHIGSNPESEREQKVVTVRIHFHVSHSGTVAVLYSLDCRFLGSAETQQNISYINLT